MEAEQWQVMHRMIMTFGNNDNGVILRKATSKDLDHIKRLVDLHKNELGFVIRSALERSIHLSEIVVAVNTVDEIIGLVHYHHRKDGQTTLYNLVVGETSQRKGIGKCLVDSLKIEAQDRQQSFILLKCPEQLSANSFYQNYGFTLSTTEQGKKKTLSIWRLDV